MRLYLDEDLSPRIAELLRPQGIDAISAHEVGNSQLGDQAQFAYARRHDPALVTRNVRDFLLVAKAAVGANMSHPGIVLVPVSFRGDEVAEIARALAAVVARYPEGVADSVIYLKRESKRRIGSASAHGREGEATMTEAGAPKQFEASDPLPDEYRQLLYKVLKVAADTETSLLFPETDWLKGIIDVAPTPEDRLRIAHLYWEELNHGWLFYKIWRDLGVTPKAEDYAGMRQVYFAETPLETWPDVVLMNCLSDRVGLYQYRNMEGCSYLPLARIIPKIAKDEVGHAALGHQSLKTLCETPQGKADIQRLLLKWYPVALDMFGRSDSKREGVYMKWGLKKWGNEELRQAFIREVGPLLAGLGLEVPDERHNRKFL